MSYVNDQALAYYHDKTKLIKAGTPGTIAKINDGADGGLLHSLKVDIEPVQDLHGYSSPWPGGGGKNLFFAGEKSDSCYTGISHISSISVENSAISFVVESSGNTNAFRLVDYPVNKTYSISFQSTVLGCRILFRIRNESDTNWLTGNDTTITGYTYNNIYKGWYKDVNNTLSPTYTVAIPNVGSYVQFGFCINNNAGAVVGNTETLSKIQIESGSSATTYTPYSNICPITGFTGVDVVNTGTNIWDEEWEAGGIDSTTGENASGNNRIRSKNYISVKPSTSYYLKFPSGFGCYLRFYDSAKVYIGTGGYSTLESSQAITAPSNAGYMRFWVYKSQWTPSYNNDISINYPATDTSYHAYQGATYSVTFPTEIGTVYGGTLDVVSGVLMVDRAYIGGSDWIQYGQSNGYIAYKIDGAPIARYITASSNKCMSNVIAEFGSFSSSNMDRNIIQPPNSQTANTYMALQEDCDASGVFLSYLLATPLTYHLSPTEIRTILGINNIFASTGNITEVKYYSNDLSEALDTREGKIHATSADTGKALTAKTVSDGKVTEWEFTDGGGLSDRLAKGNGSGAIMDGAIPYNTADGNCAHSSGADTHADGNFSYAQGDTTTANRAWQHVFGRANVIEEGAHNTAGTYIEIVGNGANAADRSNARTLDWNGNEVLAGKLTVGTAPTNDMDVATKKYVDDHAGESSFDLSDRMEKATGSHSIVINQTSGGALPNTATGGDAFACGAGTDATGDQSHAEGFETTSSGENSHAEGKGSTASGDNSHSEGYVTTASGYHAHSEGRETTASGMDAHSEGADTIASGNNSHAEGLGTLATHNAQHVFGSYNTQDPSSATASNRGTYIEIVGKGTAANARSNARTLDWNGNEVLAGKLTVGAGPTNNMDVATKQYVDNNKTIIDSTLSVSGNAADAKVTGDSLQNLADEIDAKDPLRTTSGAVASFEDGADGMMVKELVIDIDPIQDLHGYSSPWPAGGNKNVLPTFDPNNPPSVAGLTISVSQDGKITISGTVSSTTTIDAPDGTWTWDGTSSYWLSGCPSGGNVGTSYSLRVNSTSNENAYSEYDVGSGHVLSASMGSIANTSLKFRIVLRAGTYSNLTFAPMLEAGSAKTSYSPYSNICPITGWTGCEVGIYGKNLFDKTSSFVPSKYISDNGEIGSNVAYSYCEDYIRVKPSTTYVFSGDVLGNNSTIYNSVAYYDKGKKFLSRFLPSTFGINAVFTTPDNCCYIRFNASNANRDVNTIQLEEGLTATAYEPYTGNTYPISWQSSAGTVYGGKLNVTTGELTVDMASVDMGTLTWNKDDGIPIFRSMQSDVTNSMKFYGDLLCSEYIPVKKQPNQMLDLEISVTNAQVLPILRVYDSRYSDATTFKSAMSGVQLVYELATPLTYTLTPAEVTTLLNRNNIFADTGAIESCTYYTATFGDAIAPIVDTVDDLVDGKVDKVSGKGLSTEDYTTAEKTKLANLAANDVTYSSGITYSNGTVGKAVSDLKSQLILHTSTKYTELIKDRAIYPSTPDQYSTASDWECAKIACAPGDVFQIKGYGGNTTRLWFFVDSNGTTLTEASASLHTNYFVTAVAPANVAYLCVNSKYTEIPLEVILESSLANQIANTSRESVSTSHAKAPSIFEALDGSIVTFEDEVGNVPLRNLVVDIEPVQDLHGYSNPWPSGGGKNLLPISITNHTEASVTATEVKDSDNNIIGVKFSGTRNGNGQIYLYSGPVPASIVGQSVVVSWGEAINAFQVITYDSSNNRTVLINQGNTASATATIPSDAVTMDVRISLEASSYNVTIKPMIRLASVSDATFAPYSNICPITGFTEIDVSESGFNIWDEQWELGKIDLPTGAKIYNANAIRTKNYIPVIPNKEYYFLNTGISSLTAMIAFWYDHNKHYIKYDYCGNVSVTSPSNACYMLFYNGDVYGVTYNSDISINYPSTDKRYHAYTGTTVPITLPSSAGTVYGGRLDVGNGVLTVDRACVDLGDLTWEYDVSLNSVFFSASLKTKNNPVSIICSSYGYGGAYNQLSDKQIGYVYNNRICVKDSAYNDETVFKTAMSGVQAVYPLSESLTYTLDPVTIRSILGTNNIWSNSRNVHVERNYDTKNYVDNLGERKADVIVNSASGVIASFSDGANDLPVESLVVGIEPVQDLHGYNNPWPAGGGVNKLYNPGARTETINDVKWTVNADGTITVKGTASADSIFYYINGDTITLSGSYKASVYNNTNLQNMSAGIRVGTTWIDFNNTAAEVNGILNQVWFKVASGVGVDKTIYPMIVGSSFSGTDFSPYSNVCPISGWTGCEVKRAGVNLLEKPYDYWTNVSNQISNCFFIKAGTYKFHFSSSTATSWRNIIYLYDINGNKLTDDAHSPTTSMYFHSNGHWLDGADNSYKDYSITIVEDCYIRFLFGYGNTTSSTVATGVQLELGSTSTTYEQYRGTIYSITFPSEAGTVYGGTLDVTTGVLTVDRASVDLGTLTWGKDTTTRPVDGATIHAFYATLESCKIIALNKIPNIMYSSIATKTTIDTADYAGRNVIKDNLCSGADPNKRVWMYCSVYNDYSASEFKTAMSGVQLVYELITPTMVQLDPTEVRTLLEDNNIFADTGNIESCDYPADTKRYIDNKIASMIAAALNV